MRKVLAGSVLAFTAVLCGCTAADPGAGRAPATSSAAQAETPLAIRQILLDGEGGTLNSGQPPKPIVPTATIAVTVALTDPVPREQPLSLRLIDLKGGRTADERHVALAAGNASARFEFKPAQPWTSGRHLLEARLGPTGKVFQREFDVAPGPQSAPGG